jgi:hypothetical protein
MYGIILSDYGWMYTHPSGFDFFEIQQLLKPFNPTEHHSKCLVVFIHVGRVGTWTIGRRNPIST